MSVYVDMDVYVVSRLCPVRACAVAFGYLPCVRESRGNSEERRGRKGMYMKREERCIGRGRRDEVDRCGTGQAASPDSWGG